jgi:hypothetical protein
MGKFWNYKHTYDEFDQFDGVIALEDCMEPYFQKTKRCENEFNKSIYAKKENFGDELGYYFLTMEEEQNNNIFRRPFSDNVNDVLINMQNRNNNLIYYTPKEKDIMKSKPLSYCGQYPLEDDDFEKYYKLKYSIDENDMLFQIIVDFADGSSQNLCITNWSKKNSVDRWHYFRSHYLGSNYYIWS